MMEKRKKLIIKTAASILAAVLIIFVFDFLTRLMMPKYYDETLQHDVVFVGDCEVFSNISPIALYREYGITSFVRGSAQQLVWQSYYLMEETLKYEKPKAFVFNVLSLQYNEPQNEAYNRITPPALPLALVGAEVRRLEVPLLPRQGDAQRLLHAR